MRSWFFKGRFFSFPTKIRLFFGRKNYGFSIKMNESHDLNDPKEQKDWMKICGVAYSIRATKDSTMIGGRWNPQKNIWEFCVYSHIKGNDNPIYTDVIYTSKKEQRFEVELKIKKRGYVWTFPNGNSHTQPYKGNRYLGRQVSPWAGGTTPSPKTYFFWAELF